MRLLLLLLTASFCVAQTLPPITQAERLKWAAQSSAGFANVAGGAFTSAYSTLTNSPPEYGPHWDGWGKRQVLRLSGSAAGNLMEAEVGALWGEDPRYRHSPDKKFKARLLHAIKTSLTAYDRQGNSMPAYSRFVAIPASNVISNSWRPDSQRTFGSTTSRIGYGFAGRVGANVFAEFWPDIVRLVFHKK